MVLPSAADDNSSPYILNVTLSNSTHAASFAEPEKIAELFPFAKVEFSINAELSSSIVIRPLERDIGDYVIWIYFQEIFTPELYSLEHAIYLKVTRDTADDASIYKNNSNLNEQIQKIGIKEGTERK